MENTQIGVLVALVSLAVSTLLYPVVLRYARKYGIVDNPNARKLQRVPIPVMGGVVVYAGILAGGLMLNVFMYSDVLTFGLIGMTVMMMIGVWDDVKDISPLLRLLIEIALVGIFIVLTGTYIDDFHGLWGVNELEPWIGIPLSIVSGVGIINAVNLIDGVDGYSSGYGMLACVCFGFAFWTVWSQVMVCLTLIVIGALIPFFLHNVFGTRSKMFIGDGGTLMLGMLMTVLVFFAMSSKQNCEALSRQGIGLAAFTLSVLCIPVFDTLRVMTMRILRGRSPFKPDKTHLHHLFIDMGFSHIGAAMSILMVNMLIVVLWLLSWLLGASINLQTHFVLVLGILATFVFYKVMKVQQNSGPLDDEGYPQGTPLWHWFCHLGYLSHREKGRVWRNLRWLMDSRYLSRLYVKLFHRIMKS